MHHRSQQAILLACRHAEVFYLVPWHIPALLTLLYLMHQQDFTNASEDCARGARAYMLHPVRSCQKKQGHFRDIHSVLHEIC